MFVQLKGQTLSEEDFQTQVEYGRTFGMTPDKTQLQCIFKQVHLPNVLDTSLLINTVQYGPGRRHILAYGESEGGIGPLYFFDGNGKVLATHTLRATAIQADYSKEGDYVSIFNVFGDSVWIFRADGTPFAAFSFRDYVSDLDKSLYHIEVLDDGETCLMYVSNELLLISLKQQKLHWRVASPWLLDAVLIEREHLLALQVIPEEPETGYELQFRDFESGFLLSVEGPFEMVHLMGDQIYVRRYSNYYQVLEVR
ncbi:MAG: hypothetical protein KDC44_22250 [Phaeodactylibacter sp.]|nr:hypothetical protein [Phaeodactylibacter sp.]